MGVFEDSSVLLEVKNLSYKEKKKLRSAVRENGGNISFVVNKQCSLVVTSDASILSANRLRSIHKYQTPVVPVDYIYICLERGALLPVDEYKLHTSSFSDLSPCPPRSSVEKRSPSNQVSNAPLSKAVSKGSASPTQTEETPERSRTVLEKFRIYHETDSDLPAYPDDFQVAKYSIFEKINRAWCVLELQSFKEEKHRRYRVVRYWKDMTGVQGAAVRDMLVFLSSSEEALEVYKTLRENLLGTDAHLRRDIQPQVQDLGSAPLHQLLMEEKLSTGDLSEEVGVFVELLWTEALDRLGNVLRVPVDHLSLNDVSRAEGLLLQAQRKMGKGSLQEARPLLVEVDTLLQLGYPIPHSARHISDTLDLCQLIRDVLSVGEMTLRRPATSSLGKYRALRCSVEVVPPGSSEFQAVSAQLKARNVRMHQVVRVCRGVELQTFNRGIGNVRTLFHCSSPSNFVGILSRGLLLPRVAAEHHGIQRTDVGHLGSGIYFSDDLSNILKFSRPSETDGSRLLLVCEVALGRCKDVHDRDVSLTQAPEGHHSVHGVRRTDATPTDFEGDEYVVYCPGQVRLAYVARFNVSEEQPKEFCPAVVTDEPGLPASDQELGSKDDGVEIIKRDVTAALLDSSGQQLPLQAVHVKAKLMDLLAKVIIFQKYSNLSSAPIEAKYVFPLTDSAAVCGFEAFIDGKHVVGKVKEKETARKDYKQAIEKGQGAYLMDQDAPDVFTISVGNLPPGATVLIKVTFVCELVVRGGRILFSLPGSVAPWQEGAALHQTTQVTVEKVCVTDASASAREFTLDMAVTMPYEITSLKCITHQIKIKRTDCRAVLSVLPGEVMGPDGFQLSITLSEVHHPRMWVEKHPVKDSQACMLVFYPNFDVSSSSASDEVVLLLDTSESMKGESLRLAQRIALQVLKTLEPKLRLNVILFGTGHTAAFLTARPLFDAHQDAERFIRRVSPVGGTTELWRPLRALSLLPPSRGVRNLLLVSDGHIQNPELTLKLVRENTQHSRVFTCGLSATANRHMLRTLAQVGGGAFEFFDTKTKHNWAEKVASQVTRMTSPGCSSVSVKWQQFGPGAPPPVQAPQQLHALFNDCHTLVYGFVPHCIQATLFGNLSGQELQTMVSTSDLQTTRGTFLHKLTARALVRDYEDGSLDLDEAEHEGKKAEMKNFIIELSKEFSILSQFTSFVAIEDRDPEQEQGFMDIPKLVLEEDVDFLPYISWKSTQYGEEEEEEDRIDGFLCDDGGVNNDDEAESEEETVSSEEDGDFMELQYCDAAIPKSISAEPSPLSCLVKGTSVQSSRRHRTGKIGPPPPPALDPFPLPLFLSSGCSFSSQSLLQQEPPLASLASANSRFVQGGLISQALTKSSRRSELQHFGSPAPPPPRLGVSLTRQFLPQLGQTFAARAPPHSSLPTHSIFISGDPPPPPVSQQHGSDKIFSRAGLKGYGTRRLPMRKAAMRAMADEGTRVGVKADNISADSGERRDAESEAKAPSSYASSLLLAPTEVSSRFADYQEETLEELQVLSSDPSSSADEFSIGNEISGVRIAPKRRSSKICFSSSSFHRLVRSEERTLRWNQIFQMQHSKGYWELTTELGEIINVDVDVFADVFLRSRGIRSLGVKAHADILRLVATLLVLQLMRVEKQQEGNLLRTLFCLDESLPRPKRWEMVKKAVDWVRWGDRQYPSVYSRLEFGRSWESSTRQLLGFEGLPPFSPLSGLNLQRKAAHLLVH